METKILRLVKEEMDGFREEMDGFREEMDGFREEMNGFKREIREEMNGFREEMNGVKQELNEVKEDVRELKDICRQMAAFINTESYIIEEEVSTCVNTFLLNHELCKGYYIINMDDYNEFRQGYQVIWDLTCNPVYEMDGLIILTNDYQYYQYFRSKIKKGQVRINTERNKIANEINQRNQELVRAQQIINQNQNQNIKYDYRFMIIESKHKLTQKLASEKISKFENVKKIIQLIQDYQKDPSMIPNNTQTENLLKFIRFYQFEKYTFHQLHIFFGAPFMDKESIFYIKKLNEKYMATSEKARNKNEKKRLLRFLHKYHLITLSGNRYQYHSTYSTSFIKSQRDREKW